MRIVHACNLQFDKDGAHLWNQDQKIHHQSQPLGLIPSYQLMLILLNFFPNHLTDL